MPAESQKFLIEGADFLEFLEPELVRLLSEIWDRKEDPLRPCWIVIPAAPLARHLKQALLARDIPLLNVEFLTLTTLRERLTGEAGIGASLAREKQELLLRVMLSDAGRNPEASSIVLDAIDTMRDAGHPAGSAFEQEGGGFRKLVEEFEARIGRQSVQHLDRELLRHAIHDPRSTIHERDVVLYGFDAGDWPGASVLLSAVKSAMRSAVFIRNAGGQVESLELSWMAWWREHYGGENMPAAKGRSDEVRSRVLSDVMSRMFVPMREARAGINAEEPLKNPEDAVLFLRHRSASLEARDAAARAAFWASRPETRVGLIFAGANALSRLTVAHLAEWGVPFEDQLGALPADPPETTVLKLWLQIQEEGPHSALVELLARSMRELVVDTPLRRVLTDSLDEMLKWLEEGRARTMSDDLGVIARALSAVRKPGAGAIALFAGDWEKMGWPEMATPSEMKERVEDTLAYLFGGYAYELASGFSECLAGLDEILGSRPLARAEWIRYLRSLLEAARKVRFGDPYSPVVVTSLDRSRGQCFDAVIFCGLNEGGFPQPLRELPFHLDKRAQPFDLLCSTMSDDGVRHFKPGSGPILNFTALRGLERQHFWDLIGSARSRICFSCFIWDDLDAHAATEPSELYDWAWWACHGFQITELRDAEMMRVDNFTSQWSAAVSSKMPRRDPPPELDRMDAAIRARFDSGKPFGPYQFMSQDAESWRRRYGGKALSVTMAERILKDPASEWLEKVLGVSPWEKNAAALDSLKERRGSLLHDAVRQIMMAGWSPLPGELPELGRPQTGSRELRETALEAWIARLRAGVDSWFGKLPVWWEVELSDLKSAARRVMEYFSAGETPETLYAVEMGLNQSFGGIHWSAKLDHISRTGKQWAITDLKTGGGASVKELKASALAKDGEGFQLVLYAMVLAEQMKLDGSLVAIRYYHPRLRGGDEATQQTLDVLAPAALALIAYLEKAWGAGLFGQRYDFKAARPIAHLHVPNEILREKWNRTEAFAAWPWDVAPKKDVDDEEDESED